MATYAIGDIQGCFHSFLKLLDRLNFDPATDDLWLVGDIVNRGAGTLDVLRWVYLHRDRVTLVLGNHDLHALAVAEGFARVHRGDTLSALLAAEDRDALLDWLRRQPLMHATRDYVMVHAGLLPAWTVEQALALADEVHQALAGPQYRDFLAHMYGNEPAAWQEALRGDDRLRVITNAFTRLRICSPEGEMELKFKGELPDIPIGFLPWFDVPGRRSMERTILFGHWSALGLQQRANLFALDTGCLWGGQLTALRLEDRQIFQVPCDAQDSPRQI